MKQRVVKKEPWQKQKNIVFFYEYIKNINYINISIYIYICFQILNITPRSFPNMNHKQKNAAILLTIPKTPNNRPPITAQGSGSVVVFHQPIQKNMFVKLGSSSPIFGMKIKKYFRNHRLDKLFFP